MGVGLQGLISKEMDWVPLVPMVPMVPMVPIPTSAGRVEDGSAGRFQ